MGLIFSLKQVFKIGKKSRATISKSGISVGTSTKAGSVNIRSDGRASVSLKTPIKGLTYRKSKKIIKKSK